MCRETPKQTSKGLENREGEKEKKGPRSRTEKERKAKRESKKRAGWTGRYSKKRPDSQQDRQIETGSRLEKF